MGQNTHRRLVILLTVCSLTIAALLGRLFLIQIVMPESWQGHNLVTGAVAQRREMFEIDSGRGDILDRQGRSLTGSRVFGVLVMPLWQGAMDLGKVNQLAMILQANGDDVKKSLSSIEKPALLQLHDASNQQHTVEINDEQAKKIEDLQLPGVYPKHVKVRYGDDTVARHVIGFMGQDPEFVANTYEGYPLDERIGKMGIEYTFQEELRGLGHSQSIGYFVDGDKHPINGLGIRVTDEPNSSLSVKTTLDLTLQKSVEQVVDEKGLTSGAVVVLDTQTEDILAMASRPNFDEKQPIVGQQFPVNKAVSPDFPGSVFKTVIAAAALETGQVKATEKFECPGYIDIGDGRLNCWTTHGSITAEEGFAQSCNVVFATLAMRIGREGIETYAKKFGLESVISQSVDGRTLIYGETAGSIFQKKETSLRLLANTGIGQEDVRISPLQTAHLMATIANGGLAGQPRLVTELQTAPGKLVYKRFSEPSKTRVLGQPTAVQLQKWMREVVSTPKGTAHRLDDAKMTIAGKTGTAQTGDGETYNYWFAGYAPAENPRYAIVVMADRTADLNGGVLVQEIVKGIVGRF